MYWLLQILPYWDWTKYYDNDCLIENPFYEANQLTEEDCMDCQNLNTIQRKSNVSQSEMAEDYLKGDIPVIITDAMMDWPAAQSFTIQQLYDLYTQHQSLKKSVACMFSTNVRLKAGKARELLAQASRGEIGNWYAHWENCDKAAGKAIRQLYKRPYFVPPMVEMAESNWLFVAASYKGKKYKPADLAISMMLFAQVRGDTKVMLTPRDPCSETCSTLYGTVHEGEILVATDLMWLLDYQPLSAEQTISIGFGGDFNWWCTGELCAVEASNLSQGLWQRLSRLCYNQVKSI